ncbi:adenylosuccinate synthase [soil metagenome]
MPNTIIVGAQWGDEGKGKIVDYLTEETDIVVRAQGGNNAGHTVIIGESKFVLHLIPSGILWGKKTCVIGNGVVLDPIHLLQEIDGLLAQGIAVTPDNLLISEGAHLVLPYHRGLDAARESHLGTRKIGTTGRGIGPAYADKITRAGLRVADLRDPDRFRAKVEARLADANPILQAAGQDTVDADRVVADSLAAAERLLPFVVNTVAYLHRAVAEGRTLLFEGAQGTYLDIDHGTYPFVTSSNTTAGGACTGSGVPPRAIDRVVGVAKAYTTRVGSGPFVTENQAFGDKLHALGREFGATTGRPRRCGWLDLVLLRYASMVNGFDELAITILDGLDDIPEIQVCVAYTLDGQRIEIPPTTADELERCQPVYETVPGWLTDTTATTAIDQLPPNARAYLDCISGSLNVPVTLVGIGPDRAQTLSATRPTASV